MDATGSNLKAANKNEEDQAAIDWPGKLDNWSALEILYVINGHKLVLILLLEATGLNMHPELSFPFPLIRHGLS